MTNPVVLFGSFTELEASSYQSGCLEPLHGKRNQSLPLVKSNGVHSAKPPSVVVTQNGYCSPVKSIANSRSPVSTNGKASLSDLDSLEKTNGQNLKQHPPELQVAVARREAQSPTKIAIEGGSNSVKHTSSPSLGAISPAETADQPDWLLVSTLDITEAKVSSTNGEPPSSLASKSAAYEPFSKGFQTEKVLEKNGSGDAAVGNSETPPLNLLPKSWAALVGLPGETDAIPKQPAGIKTKSKASVVPISHKSQTGQDVTVPVTDLSGPIWLKSLREAEASCRRLQPRGLINTGNSCFLNSTVQAMLSCSAFTHLLEVLKARTIPKTGYPTLQAFVEFFGEFESLAARNQTKTKRDGDGKPAVAFDVGRPFAPAMFNVVLQSFTPDQPPRGTGHNRQEDAQEFLSFVIDRMHEEILRLQRKDSGSLQSVSSITSSEDEDWEMVGPKNRSAVTRTHMFRESAIMDIFGGQLRSVVKIKGNKASATVQPFLVLHLDIVPEVVHSVEDALRFFAAPESLEGYKPSTAKVGEVVSASKSVKIQTLPRVLILHLMRFSYGTGGSSKLHKPVQFPLELNLGRELLATATTSGNEIRKYELVATLSHHGKDPSVGHYTANSKQASGQWLHFDDGVVSVVGVTRVQQEQAYVLFYKRSCH